jgi:mercuric ion binding protein
MAIAAVGYDTEMHKAKDEVYNKLPECCKYDRSVDLGEKKMDKK